jgi:hypothetical protein
MSFFFLCWGPVGPPTKQARAKDETALGELFDEEDQYLKLVEAESPNLEKIFARYLDLSKMGI